MLSVLLQVIFLKGSISEKETKGEVWCDDDCYY